MIANRLIRYLATGEYTPVPVQDAAPDGNPSDLQKHDKRFHPNGYKDGDHCQYREEHNLTPKSDKEDDLSGGGSVGEVQTFKVGDDVQVFTQGEWKDATVSEVHGDSYDVALKGDRFGTTIRGVHTGKWGSLKGAEEGKKSPDDKEAFMKNLEKAYRDIENAVKKLNHSTDIELRTKYLRPLNDLMNQMDYDDFGSEEDANKVIAEAKKQLDALGKELGSGGKQANDDYAEARALGYFGSRENASSWLNEPEGKSRREDFSKVKGLTGGDFEKAKDLYSEYRAVLEGGMYAGAKAKRDALEHKLGDSPEARSLIKRIDDVWDRRAKELSEGYASGRYMRD